MPLLEGGGMPLLALPVGVFVALFGAVAALVWHRPLLARIAWREAVRRPGQSLLVVAGLAVGSAAITAAAVVADTAREVFTLNTYRGAAHVDATISAGGRPFPATVADELATNRRVAAAVDGVQAGAELVTAVANLDRERRRSQIRLVGFDPGAQAPFGAFTLEDGGSTLGDDLAFGEVLLSADLAAALEAQRGDRLRIPVEGTPGGSFPATVAGVAEPTGPGAYGLRPTVFAPMATLEQAIGPGLATVVRVTAAGTVFGGVAEADEARPVLDAALAGVDTAGDLFVTATKADALEAAEDSWPVLFLTAMSVAMAAIVVAAGLALTVALAHMLAEERRTQNGVLRALGLRGRDVVRLAVVEGALYSLAAALIGAAVGVGAGWLVTSRLLTAVTAGEELSELTVVLAVRPLMIAAAIALGASVTLVTLAAASRRSTRASVVAAIRLLPGPTVDDRRGGRRRLAFAALLAAAGVSGLAVSVLPVRTLAGFVLVGAAALALHRRLPVRLYASATGTALIGWAGVMGVTAVVDEPGALLAVWAVAVIGVVFGLSLVVAAHLRFLDALVGRAGSRLRATLRPPIAELARRPVRTGLAIGAFAMALAVVALLAALQAMLPRAFEVEVGDVDIIAQGLGSGAVDLPETVAADVDWHVALPTLSYLGPLEYGPWPAPGEQFLTLMVVPEAVPDAVGLDLLDHDDAYANAEEVWAALADDPSLALAVNATPGDTFTLHGRDGPATFTVVGAVAGDVVGWNTFLFGEVALRHFHDLPLGTTMLLAVRPGADVDTVAARIERAAFAAGVEARTVASILEEITGSVTTMFSGIDVFVRFALVVGVATLGILALRAAVERRRTIGMLRALGYRRRQILAGLLAENLVLAAIGIMVGLAAGLFTGALLLAEAIPESVGFSADPRPIAAAVALVVAATVAVSVGPAVRAARLAPAEAAGHLE